MNTVVMAHPPTPSRKEPALQIGRGLQVALGAIAAVAFIALVASVFVFTWPVTVGLAGALALSAIAYTTLFLATKSISARNPPSLSGTEAAPPPDLPPLLASAADAAPPPPRRGGRRGGWFRAG